MKFFVIVALSLVGFLSSVKADDTGKHLFILSGQSNMARLDPNVSFTPALEAAFGKPNITVVKDAQGGQPIRRWYKQWKPQEGAAPESTGDLYDRLMKKVEQAGGADDFATVTFVWMQGERDAREKQGAVYAASLKGLVAQLSEDLGRKDIQLVVGRLSDYDLENRRFAHWTMVREALVEVAESNPRGAWVDTDDLNDLPDPEGGATKNDLHYTPEGYREFGKRLAEASIRLIQSATQAKD